LLQAIVYQQIAGKAAEAIFGRVKALAPAAFPTPEESARAKRNCAAPGFHAPENCLRRFSGNLPGRRWPAASLHTGAAVSAFS